MLYEESREQLLAVAETAILEHLEGHAFTPNLAEYPQVLHPERATFVTLNKEGRLRGCIGTLEPREPLVRSVASNAINAAFRDGRFPALQADEYEELDIHISILSPPEPLEVDSLQALLQVLIPGEDGLILQDGAHRATFLPSVWRQITKPDQFVDRLLDKAGLSAGHWSADMRVWRYQTEEFGRAVRGV